jgi:hypothetical protein
MSPVNLWEVVKVLEEAEVPMIIEVVPRRGPTAHLTKGPTGVLLTVRLDGFSHEFLDSKNLEFKVRATLRESRKLWEDRD